MRDKKAEAEAMAALTQGAIVGTIPAMAEFAKFKKVEQPRDEEGNYEPFFFVTFESGIKIRIDVTVVETSQKE